ncbi:hypothetical protein P692DRAFT_20881641 [Suillus brevipes Sb2]|nr:hypothetical protein P692DRAFT_20881641 [Suillus brevipes Sb2]
MFPRLKRHSHATLASPTIHCHEQFALFHPLEVTLSLEYHRLIHAHRHITLALLQSSPYHSGSHLHIIQAVITITSPSLHCVCMHQSHFAQSATLPRFHAPMTPYACAFPAPSAPSLHQSRLITFASDTLALHSSRTTYPHHNFAWSPHDALSGDTQNLSPQEM